MNQFLKQLLTHGYLSPSFFNHIEIKDRVNTLTQCGFTHGQAVLKVAEEMKCSKQYIYGCLRSVKQLTLPI